MHKLLSLILSRPFIVALGILLQLGIIVGFFVRFNEYFIHFYLLCFIISILVVIMLMNKNLNPDYKIAWILLVVAMPVFGGVFYLMVGSRRTTRKSRRMATVIEANSIAAFHDDEMLSEQLINDIAEQDERVASQARYLSHNSPYALYENTKVTYYPIGEEQYAAIIDALKKAKHYIFLEYFIIEEGIMWDSILAILEQKVAEGLDVRLMYDDIGCLFTLPSRYARQINAKGIKCKVFNPFKPVLSIRHNNRDHRKIIIIDGHTAFTGGTNLADEYINAKVKYGHWKDNGVKVEGDAAWSFTVMFLNFWDHLDNADLEVDNAHYAPYRPNIHQEQAFVNDGYILPYCDGPTNGEPLARNAYLNMINQATESIYLYTPYLVPDHETLTAFCNAARSGVTVRIVTPHIPDKKLVFQVTRANYAALIESGVEIYEYTPGFIHAKTMLCDGQVAIIGTVNMDFRSLYLHHECAVWLYQNACLSAIKQDFIDTLKKSQMITLKQCHSAPYYRPLINGVLKFFAPLM